MVVVPPSAVSPPDNCRSGTAFGSVGQTLAEKQRESPAPALVTSQSLSVSV